MALIKAIAIDDEPPALAVLESFCEQSGEIELTKTFSKPLEALKHVRKFPVDLLFLDIQMPSMSGLEFVKSLEQDTMVIFTTAFSEYAVEGFNLDVVDFLLKPFSYERFMQAVTKARDYYEYAHQSNVSDTSRLFIRADYSLIQLQVSDILYVEGMDDYLKIHLVNKKMIVARMTMKGIQDKLPAAEFVRIHRSFIVSVKNVDKVSRRKVFIGGIEIPVGASYAETFQKIFKPDY